MKLKKHRTEKYAVPLVLLFILKERGRHYRAAQPDCLLCLPPEPSEMGQVGGVDQVAQPASYCNIQVTGGKSSGKSGR